ncbi:DUF3939 domain-containing protein [Bacillus shivajii]|uniref:DUF3939 domain-containing protein n=1 Tax=Bacillus shivajii TaxID=1983719 RepID=UPI001CFB9AD0|nr:DUF3939 domain-containing protein [Bacillus shivajii]UCZ54109.1 DUF3939 domain-containing protein [Bacillus shivajii]
MFFGKRRKKKNEAERKKEVKVVSVTIDDVREAVNNYAKSLQKGVSLRSIVLDSHEVDYDLLCDYLGGKPDKPFYMSKETFEIFEDPNYPKHIDQCQIACDQYLLEKGEEPVINGDPYRKLSYFKLQDYLVEKPPFDLYLHPDDRMVTHRKSKK